MRIGLASTLMLLAVANAWAGSVTLAAEDMPVGALARVIARRAGIVLEVDPALDGRRVSASFRHADASDALHVLAALAQASLEPAGDGADHDPPYPRLHSYPFGHNIMGDENLGHTRHRERTYQKGEDLNRHIPRCS